MKFVYDKSLLRTAVMMVYVVCLYNSKLVEYSHLDVGSCLIKSAAPARYSDASSLKKSSAACVTSKEHSAPEYQPAPWQRLHSQPPSSSPASPPGPARRSLSVPDSSL